MDKKEYLKQLEKYLRCLPKDDFEQAMGHFEEYFDEVGPEGEAGAITELGTPREAAYELLSQLLETGEKPSIDKDNISGNDSSKVYKGHSDENIEASKETYSSNSANYNFVSNHDGSGKRKPYIDSEKKKLSTGAIIAIAIISLFAAPIAIPTAISALLAILAAVAFTIAMIVAAILLCFAGFVVSGKLIITGFLSVATSIPAAIGFVGGGLFGLGICLSIVALLAIGFRLLGQFIRMFAKWVTSLGGKKNEKMD